MGHDGHGAPLNDARPIHIHDLQRTCCRFICSTGHTSPSNWAQCSSIRKPAIVGGTAASSVPRWPRCPVMATPVWRWVLRRPYVGVAAHPKKLSIGVESTSSLAGKTVVTSWVHWAATFLVGDYRLAHTGLSAFHHTLHIVEEVHLAPAARSVGGSINSMSGRTVGEFQRVVVGAPLHSASVSRFGIGGGPNRPGLYPAGAATGPLADGRPICN